MALFEEQITDTLETGAPPIKYEGDEGPQDPRQEAMLAQLKEEYMQYVFEMRELDEPILSFEEWYQMTYKASEMGAQAPQEEMMSEEMMMREPAAYGGIMDTESGRRMYGLGSIFKKITKIPKKIFKGAKKVLKSPLGKAAALYFAPALIPGGASTMGGVLKNAMSSRLPADWLGKAAREKTSNKGILSAAKKFLTGNKGIAAAGIGALSALPLLGIGTQKQDFPPPMSDQSGSFGLDYEDEIIRGARKAATSKDLAQIKAFNEKYGTDLVEDIDVYQGAADGGRIGYADGSYNPGARWSYLIDKFNNNKPMTEDEIKEMEMLEITYADESKGMAQGGRIGYANGADYYANLYSKYTQDMIKDGNTPMSIEDFVAIIKEQERTGNAQGGRIGYQDGSMVEKIKEGIIESGKSGPGAPFIDEAIWIEKIKDFIRKKRGDPREDITQEEIIEQLRPRDPIHPMPMRPPMRPMPDMPRRRYALGSKADFAIEDIMTGGVEDEIGGITGIMRQADLQRKGNIGQFYAAEGGSPSDEFMELVAELREQGYTQQEAIDEAKLRLGMASGGRIGKKEGGIMDLGGMEKDYRETGGFVDIGAEEKADDVPARLSVNEFVMTADAVRGAGDGDIDLGAERMEDTMKQLEQQGKRNQGASDMFEVSERLSEVI